MCFTYRLNKSANALEERFGAGIIHKQQPVFFDAPDPIYNGFTYPKMPVITNSKPNSIQFFEWGLLPKWAKDKSFQKNTLNARIETLSEKPSFRDSVNRRCLIPSDGFIEWRWLDEKGKNKQKYLVHFENDLLYAFAGIWSVWEDQSIGELIPTFSIITTEANELMSFVHNTKKRMPVIIKPEFEKEWLEAGNITMWNDELVATAI
ncbi:MAG TPA: SOS response-associated peptidase [Paludibacter sp.]|nr:SOS response-associated peptidase [Paludibacter sp.]HOS45483.1 SOS response-associated peptidase [Paludibacter sp.]HPM09023.1 SOS response-associated peptidase [Paludibacter sp.]